MDALKISIAISLLTAAMACSSNSKHKINDTTCDIYYEELAFAEPFFPCGDSNCFFEAHYDDNPSDWLGLYFYQNIGDSTEPTTYYFQDWLEACDQYSPENIIDALCANIRVGCTEPSGSGCEKYYRVVEGAINLSGRLNPGTIFEATMIDIIAKELLWNEDTEEDEITEESETLCVEIIEISVVPTGIN